MQPRVKMTSSGQQSFHPFGDLWLEDPALHLTKNDLAKVENLKPYFHQLEIKYKGMEIAASFYFPPSVLHANVAAV